MASPLTDQEHSLENKFERVITKDNDTNAPCPHSIIYRFSLQLKGMNRDTHFFVSIFNVTWLILLIIG